MSLFNTDSTQFVADSDVAGADLQLLNRNAATTAAVGLACATGGVGAAIMLAGLPVPTLAAGVSIAGLAYVGDRQYKNLPINPFDKSDDSSDTQDAEATPSAA